MCDLTLVKFTLCTSLLVELYTLVISLVVSCELMCAVCTVCGWVVVAWDLLDLDMVGFGLRTINR